MAFRSRESIHHYYHSDCLRGFISVEPQQELFGYVTFIEERHYTVLERDGNGVRYVRVQDGNLVQLGMQIVEEFYHLRSDSEMEMFTDGFEWHSR